MLVKKGVAIVAIGILLGQGVLASEHRSHVNKKTTGLRVAKMHEKKISQENQEAVFAAG